MGESMIEEKLPVLKVHMLGGFSMEYGDKPISFRRYTATKSMKLLQILLHCGEGGIARGKLLESLYGREELADVANNLRVTSHRLKKMLVDAGLPEYDYIQIKSGIYRWSSPMEVEVDVHVFSNLVNSSKTETSEDKKIQLLKSACWIVNSKLNNFFKVILPVLNWCQVTERGMKSVIVKPIHIISKPQF